MKKLVLSTISVVFAVLGFSSLLLPMIGTSHSEDGVISLIGMDLFHLGELSDSALTTIIMIVGIVILVLSALLVVCSLIKNKTLLQVKTISSILLIIFGVLLLILAIAFVGDLNSGAISLANYAILPGIIDLVICSVIAGTSALLSKLLKK